MQRIIKVLRQGRTDTGRALEIHPSGFEHTLQAPEVLQQSTTFGGSEAGNRLEYGLVESPRTPPTMTGDRESMRLVPQLLDQLQTDGLRAGNPRWSLSLGGVELRKMDALLTRPAIGALGDADDRLCGEPRLVQHRDHAGELRREIGRAHV